MGLIKDLWIQAGDIGWFPNGDGKYVCRECIEDEALQRVLEENLEHKMCSYCGRKAKTPIAAPLDKITEHMAICISREYTDPAEVLPYEGREGGYQVGTIYDTIELFEEIGFWVENEELMKDICSSFVRNDWTIRDWLALSPDQRKFFGWNEFKRTVKHKRRYTFWSMDDEDEDRDHPDYMPVGNMLAEIAKTIQIVNIIQPLKKGTSFWRIRIHKQEKTLKNDTDFASPTVEQAKLPNRMSPAGIPMFYGAEDFETACIETIDKERIDGKVATGARFINLVELNILNLADLPTIPSYFDKDKFDLRNDLIFMVEFARDISQPIIRDGREHIEYVPTQAFTEYIRWMFNTSSGAPIDGICYRSSKNDKKCYVLFFTQEECIDNPEFHVKKQCLKFQPDSLNSIDLS